MISLALTLISTSIKSLPNIWFDSLTGVLCSGCVKSLIEGYILGGKCGSLALFDLDDFKKINDTYGHLVGDRVLVDFCRKMKKVTRKGDFFGRLGGEEFLLFMPKTTLAEASEIISRLYRHFSENPIMILNSTLITFSCGVTSILDGDNFNSAYNRTDKAMYLAKSKGKNRFDTIS